MTVPRPNKRRQVGAKAVLAKNVRFHRETHGWSPELLAKMLGERECPIPVSAIYKIEKQERSVDPDELVTLAEVFNVSIAGLLGREQGGELPPELKKKVDLFRRANNRYFDAQVSADDAEEYCAAMEHQMVERLSELENLPATDRAQLLNSFYVPREVREALAAMDEQ
jgi:transcriptional regulator with XRE-family HTH domain